MWSPQQTDPIGPHPVHTLHQVPALTCTTHLAVQISRSTYNLNICFFLHMSPSLTDNSLAHDPIILQLWARPPSSPLWSKHTAPAGVRGVKKETGSTFWKMRAVLVAMQRYSLMGKTKDNRQFNIIFTSYLPISSSSLYIYYKKNNILNMFESNKTKNL